MTVTTLDLNTSAHSNVAIGPFVGLNFFSITGSSFPTPVRPIDISFSVNPGPAGSFRAIDILPGSSATQIDGLCIFTAANGGNAAVTVTVTDPGTSQSATGPGGGLLMQLPIPSGGFRPLKPFDGEAVALLMLLKKLGLDDLKGGTGGEGS